MRLINNIIENIDLFIDIMIVNPKSYNLSAERLKSLDIKMTKSSFYKYKKLFGAIDDKYRESISISIIEDFLNKKIKDIKHDVDEISTKDAINFLLQIDKAKSQKVKFDNDQNKLLEKAKDELLEEFENELLDNKNVFNELKSILGEVYNKKKSLEKYSKKTL